MAGCSQRKLQETRGSQTSIVQLYRPLQRPESMPQLRAKANVFLLDDTNVSLFSLMAKIIRNNLSTPCFLQHAIFHEPVRSAVTIPTAWQHTHIMINTNDNDETSTSSGDGITNRIQSRQYELMESALQSLLLNDAPSDLQCGLSPDFVRGLLMNPGNETLSHMVCNPDGCALHRKLMGLPERPFYKEIIRRLQIIHDHKIDNFNTSYNEVDENSIMFLPAVHFGMTECKTTDDFIPPPSGTFTSEDECKLWLQNTGERGILSLLGMRRTVGTASMPSNDNFTRVAYLLPPSCRDLIKASMELHKPNSKSSLTVGARALTKHADRGKSRFFGVIQGSESMINDHAENVIKKLIREASWINIHNFGGTESTRPVIEVRTAEGYGARWSAFWKDAFTPEQIAFRGFLEPQMEDGHEKRWRH